MDMTTTQGIDLVGTKEAAAIFGVRTQNFRRDWVTRPDFPTPIATLAATPVWSRSELERYRDRAEGVRWPKRSRHLKLSPAAARWLPTMKRRLVRRYEPERIVLFGSQARGDARADSDLDLLVVVASAPDARELRIAMRNSLRDIPVPKDIFLTTQAHASEHGDLVGTMLRRALREGVTIYARR